MTEPRDIIARGRTLTGRKLLQAIEGASTQVVGGRGIIVTSVAGKAVVNLKGRPIIPSVKAPTFPALLNPDITPVPPDPVEFATNRWDYPWIEAALEPLPDGDWLELSEGRRWDDPGRIEARNTTERGNNATIVQHGIELDQTFGNPGFTLTIEPLPQDTLVWIHEVKDVLGANTYWFTAYNQLKPTCGAGLEAVLPPPPTIDVGAVA